MFVVASCGLNFINLPAFAQSSNCSDVKFIFARGSGESLEGPSMSAWRDEIIAAIGGNSTDADSNSSSNNSNKENANNLSASNAFSYSFYELGSKSQNGHQYPAVAVSDSFNGYINLVGAYVSGGDAFEFGKSVEEGINELHSYISSISTKCPRTKFVLGGYSQGAMVLSASLPTIDADKIIYVSTFGDPKLYLPEGQSKFIGVIPKIPDACRGLNFSEYRISVPDCRAYEGVLGSYRPYQPEGYTGKLGTWCNASDIMCSSGFSISDHTSYVSSNLYRDAASVIAQKLSGAFAKYTWSEVLRIAKHNVAFIIDTTGSMRSTIEQYRAAAKALAARVKADGGDVALLEYKDLSYGFPTHELCDFSCDLDAFADHLDNLTLSSGGDLPESALSAMLYAMDNLNWQSGATKSIVLLTDAAYHEPDYDDTTMDDVIRRSLEIDPVNIFAVTPNDSDVYHAYDDITAATSGQIFILGQSDLDTASKIIFERPVARLALSTYAGQIGDELYFDASSSYSSDGSELRYDWDLDGDGKFELTNSDAAILHTYDHETEHFIQVRVTDQTGRTSTMSAKVVITDQLAALATITNLAVTTQEDGTLLVSFHTDGEKVLLATGDLVRGFLRIQKGTCYFVLGNVPTEMDITLTPYSSSDVRGISETTTVPTAKALTFGGSSVPTDPTDPLTPTNPLTPTTPPVSTDSPTSDGSTTSTVSSLPPNSSSSLDPTTSQDLPAAIPKAPNTGLASRKRH